MEEKKICFDNYWTCFGFYKTECITFNVLPIEPSKAICNIKQDDELSEQIKKFLNEYNFDLQKIGCPVIHDKKKFYYAKFKPTKIQYNKDGVLIDIEFEWNG